MKQKNLETQQELEFVIAPQKDFQNLPTDLKAYVALYFQLLPKFNEAIGRRVQTVLKNQDDIDYVK